MLQCQFPNRVSVHTILPTYIKILASGFGPDLVKLAGSYEKYSK